MTLAEQGKLADALALLDERIAVGGEDKEDYEISRAALQGEFGDVADALAMLDRLIAATPGNWRLHNARCYMKAQRKQQLDSAITDCSKALELGGNAGVLDSRALAWTQLGQNDKALADVEAALALEPDLLESRFLRAALLARLGRAAEGARDLAIARRLDPQVDRMFARYGITLKK
jgi:tetratricopeptide (TPR) repeat protein